MTNFPGTAQGSDDKIVVDRQSLQELKAAIGRCCLLVAGMRVNEIFVEAAGAYLKADEEEEAEKIFALLKVWIDVVPEQSEELADELHNIWQTTGLMLQLNLGNQA